MSKGLGSSYLTAQMIAYHKSDLLNNVCHVVEDGKKVAMSRYYKNKIYTDFERKRIAAAGSKRSKEEYLKDTELLEPVIDEDGVIVEYLPTLEYNQKHWAENQAKIQASKNWLKESTKGERL